MAFLLLTSGWQSATAATSQKPAPLAVELVPNTEASEPGDTVSAEVRVRTDERESLSVSVRATAPISLLGVTNFTLPVEAGAEAIVPIRYAVAGRGEAELRVSVRGSGSAVAVLYVLATGEEVLHGRAGPLALRVEALERRRAAGSLSAKGFETALAAATGGGGRTEAVTAATPGTVSGVVRWTDSAGGVYPVRLAPVELRRAAGGDAMAVTTSGEDGSYSLPTPVGGDYVVRMLARGPGFVVRSPEGTDAHHVDSEPRPMGPDVATGLDLTTGNVEDNATAFSVADAILTGARYTESRHGSPPPQVDILFPSRGTFYDPRAAAVHLLQLDRFDWDVALHEYGHHVSRFLGLDASPGGFHFPGANLSEFFGKENGIHLAWGEGWPTFFGISLQRETGAAGLGIPFVGDDTYSDTEDADFHFGLEAETELFPRSGVGEDDELSVMRILWDAYDAADDEGDFGLALGDAQLWQLLEGARTVTLSDAFQALAAGQALADVEQIGCVFTEHSVAPARVGPADEELASRQPPTFTWRANGGGPSFRNDQFVLELYDATLSRLLLASPPLTTTSYTPSRADWSAAQDGAGSTIRWLVRGAQSAEPPTGPYAGCSRGFVPPEPPPPVPELPFEIVAELGMPAPGGGMLLNHFEVAGLNHRGEVGFVTDVEEGQGLFVARDGELREVVRTGTDVAGVTLGAGSIDQVSLNDSGETAFAWALGDSFPAPFGRGAGLFRADAHGHVDTLMLPGVTPAPGGGVFEGARMASIANGGAVAFLGVVDDETSYGMYVALPNGQLVAVARPGEPAPGGGVFGSAFPLTFGWGGGDVVFAATIAGVPGRGLFRFDLDDGRLEVIVRPGDPAPGDRAFRTVGRSVANARGDVLFASSVLHEGGILPGELYLATDTGIEAVAQIRDELPDGGFFSSLLGGLGALGLNDEGDVAFFADTLDEEIGERHVVYASFGGQLRAVVRDFDDVPGLGIVVVSQTSPALIDQHGNAVFALFSFDGRELLLRETR